MGLFSTIISGIIYTAGGLVALAGAGLYLFQESLIYHPTQPSRTLDELPDRYNLPYVDLEIVTQDGIKLHSWLIRHPSPERSKSAPTLLYFHGNAGNISHRLPDVRNFLYRVGCNVLMVSYRGYGRSEGRPNETGMKMDAEAALQYLTISATQLNIDHNRIFLFGRSIGGAVAFSLAAKHQHLLKGIIVENTFLSINHMIDRVLPLLKAFKFLNRNTWATDRIISRTNLPILFISGLKDELVPPAHMKQLYQLAANSRYKAWHEVKNGTHNDTWYKGGALYYQAIADFIQKVEQDDLSKVSQ